MVEEGGVFLILRGCVGGRDEDGYELERLVEGYERLWVVLEGGRVGGGGWRSFEVV